MSDSRQRKSTLVNLWGSRIIPLLMLAAFAHSMYLVTYVVGGKNLLPCITANSNLEQSNTFSSAIYIMHHDGKGLQSQSSLSNGY
jgi:hypothetical protein